MLKNALIAAVVALVVGCGAGGYVASVKIASLEAQLTAPADELGATAARGDVVNNLLNLANDLNISGKADQGTTTLRLISQKTTQGVCVEGYATSSLTKVNVVFAPTAATSSFAGALLFKYGACK